jgi:SAM-dependent methyltransferase
MIEAARDVHTIRSLEAVGVGDGWHCLDAGAGGGSIARWLGQRVGPAGRVLATDLETDALEKVAAPNVEVLRHDILSDDLPAGAFDLAHARFLLIWLPQRDVALTRIVAAVKPGGWVLVDDVDLRAAAPARPSDVFERVFEAFLTTMSGAGADIAYGERVPEALEANGLVDVQADGVRAYTRGGSALSQVYVPTIDGARDEMIEGGRVSEPDVDEVLELLADPSFAWWTGTTWFARGRRPE